MCHRNDIILQTQTGTPKYSQAILLAHMYVSFCAAMQEKKRTEAALGELRRGYETEVCELQCKIQRMQMVKCFPHCCRKEPVVTLLKRLKH